MASRPVVAIVQARLGSSRLPEKVLAPLGKAGEPVLAHVVRRAKQIKSVNYVIVACPEKDEDRIREALGATVDVCSAPGILEQDVLSRFHHVARIYKAEWIIRITGDCPFFDPEIAEDVLTALRRSGVDYASNIHPTRIHPDGLDVEAFTWRALQDAMVHSFIAASRPPPASDDELAYVIEHVTPFMRHHLRTETIERPVTDLSHLRWTLDTPDDLIALRALMLTLEEMFPPERWGGGFFSWHQTRRAAETLWGRRT